MRNLTKPRLIDEALTITAGAYSAADVIGGLQTLDVDSAGGGGVIREIIVIDDDNEKAEITLYFFSAAPSTIADNAAFAPTVADLKKLLGFVTVAAANYTTVNSNAYAVKTGVDINYLTSDGNLYVYGVVTATPTYTAATDLHIRYIVEMY